MSNGHSIRIGRKRAINWEAFDACDRATKELCWYNTSGTLWASASLSPARLKKLRAQIAERDREATRRFYGPDHPQARALKRELQVADLDFSD